jgi:hypothetical protein
MKTRRVQNNHSKELADLRRRERQVACSPSAVSYLELADQYLGLGMGKESDRLTQLAEALENGEPNPNSSATTSLLSGSASPIMLAEVIQILTRTQLSGDFTIDGQAQVFHLYFEKGRIINAASQQHPEGIESFYMAMRVPFGTYHFIQKPVTDISRLIEDSTDMLLLHAMHEADCEAAQHSTL